MGVSNDRMEYWNNACLASRIGNMKIDLGLIFWFFLRRISKDYFCISYKYLV